MEDRPEIDSRQQRDSPQTTDLENPEVLESRRCNSCKRIFKSEVGVKIHQTKMKCYPKMNLLHRAEEISDEAEERPSQEANHSAEILNVKESSEVNAPSNAPVKERIKWPPMNDHQAWKEFEEDVVQTLEMALCGSVDRTIQVLANVMHAMGKNRFGIQEKKERSTPVVRPNRREKEIADIRRELKQLKKQWLQASVEEKIGLDEIRDDLRERLKSIRRAEYYRNKRRRREKARSKFVSSPYQYVKQLLGTPKNGTLESSMDEVKHFLTENYADNQRHNDLPIYDKLVNPSQPKIPFKLSDITLEEVTEVVKSARSKSAPGFSGTSYKVYKKCPKLLKLLWKILRVIWKKECVPTAWQRAEGCFVPKGENSLAINQFRTISLLSVECKIFFAILSKRMTNYMLANEYLDVSVQKGGVPGFSGCVEITSVLTQLIREAREGKGDLSVVWLDLTNAYGSIPHKLVETTLIRYHMPVKVQNIVSRYYENFYLRFSCNKGTSGWQRLEKGIITGDTISVILFASAMNMLVKTAETECKGPVMNSGIRQPPAKAFMDDLTVATTYTIQTRWLLSGLESVIKWARMKFNAAKSRSLVIKNGKVFNRLRFRVDKELIPTLSEKPIKCLGKTFDDTLKDGNNVKCMGEQLDKWLEVIDKSELPGKYKVWCYQHGILPRVLWPLMIYDCAIGTVEAMEKRISKKLRKWLGVPPSFTNIGLYGKDIKLQMPISSLTEEYKVGKVRASLTLTNSKDECVQKAGVVSKTGRKWKTDAAIDLATVRLRHKDLIGPVSQNRAGLGSQGSTYQRFEGSSVRQERNLIVQELRNVTEEERGARAVSMGTQGAWTKWESAVKRVVTWNDLWRMEPLRIKFMLRATYDLLPTPTNLVRWGISEEVMCPLCNHPCHLEHVLSSCKVALTQQRYTWRHNEVLRVIAHHLDLHRKQVNKTKPVKPKGIAFVKTGERVKPVRANITSSVLSTAQDWELIVDVGKQLQIPHEIVITNMRPDIVLFSRKQKTVCILELTVPWETRIDEAHERKRLKYVDLQTQCIENGWKTICFPIEVGCRGFVATSLVTAFGKLGVRGKNRKIVIRKVGEAAERASNWLWIKRQEPAWEHQG